MALNAGPGDAIVTTPYTFFATAGSIARVGATPVFIDIDPETYNISVPALKNYLATCTKNAEGKLTTSKGDIIRALMPVHLFGVCAEMDEILDLAKEYDLPVIEDAAQALGANYASKTGVKHAGAIGDFGCYSFFPSKNLGAFGDAGMVVCQADGIAEKLRALRNHGGERRYYHKMIGGNFRIDALQAAVLRLKLPHLDSWSAKRQQNAATYRRLFAAAGLDKVLALPTAPAEQPGVNNLHIYNQFVVRAPRRDELCAHLQKNGIGHAIYYPVPLHLQECFAYLGYKEGDLPESERAAKETVALPIFPELTEAQIERVVEVIATFYC
jgi:dTDP-4-amino-4,6-dideoxygalactose transaminase